MAQPLPRQTRVLEEAVSELTPGALPSQAPHQGLAAPGASPLPFVGVAVGQARGGQAEKGRLGPSRDGGGFLAGGRSKGRGSGLD